MIVRDEESVIERALLSAIPWIQTYMIVDTGSTDRTKEVVRRVMTEADISGTIVDRPWVDFGHNRTEALQLCRDKMEWAIMLDADDNLAGQVVPRATWDHLEVDAFAMRIRHDHIFHNRLQIFRVEAGWRYEGVLHEMPACSLKEPKVVMLPPTVFMETRCAGYRSRDPQKYLKDAAVLEKEYAKAPTSRTLYYLAQSYRDAGRPRDAVHFYRKYVTEADADANKHELYIAMMNLIMMSDDPAEQLRTTWAAIELCPDRLEAGYTAMRAWRLSKRQPTQQLYALASCCKNRQPDIGWPYVNPAIYEWGYDEEFAVLAFSTGHVQEAYDTFMRCAVSGPTAEFRENIVKNAQVVARSLRGANSKE
jgi:hypothetical protein